MARPHALPRLGALVLLILGVIGAPAHADHDPRGRRADPPERSTIGIRLLEASSNRRDDPRARLYIVDHINPGTTISRRFEVRNGSDVTRTIRVYAGGAEIRKNAFTPLPERVTGEPASWITVDRPRLAVPPRTSVTLKATIGIPENATEGERYGVLLAETSSEGPSPQKNLRMINRVGIRLYLDIGPGGDRPSDFEIERLTPGRTETGMPVVKATVRNTGERALDFEGRMWLSDGPGGLSAGPFPAQVGTTVAPGGTAPVMVVLDERLPDGPWGVKLELRSGQVERTVTGTLTFPAKPASWGLPAFLDEAPSWLLPAGAVTALALPVALVVRARRRSAARDARQAGPPAAGGDGPDAPAAGT
ncbi:hypothetical protein AB0L05_34080 [Nonomuraea pusilla]|uniref:hypothetical protein n=1 Tax=Nonomuraea pusilla TaxID=46177 RepID=UPI003333A74E